jgi:hypothetical protein
MISWRCFHCDEVFTNVTEAGEHFGLDVTDQPACVEVLTEGEKALVETKRQAQRDAREAEEEAEKCGHELSAWRTAVRGVHTSHDLRHRWDSLEGSLLAAQARIKQLVARLEAHSLEVPDYE